MSKKSLSPTCAIVTMAAVGVIIVLGFLFVRNGVQKLSGYFYVHSHYQQTRCLIQNTTVEETGSDDTSTYYGVKFQYLISASEARGYRYTWFADNWMQGSQDEAQTVADRYQIGHYYRCWYDPTQPDQAVLIRDLAPSAIIVSRAFYMLTLLLLSILPLSLLVFVSKRMTRRQGGWIKRLSASRLGKSYQLGAVRSEHSQTYFTLVKLLASSCFIVSIILLIYVWPLTLLDALWSPESAPFAVDRSITFLAILVAVYMLAVVLWHVEPFLYKYGRVYTYEQGMVIINKKRVSPHTVVYWKDIKRVEQTATSYTLFDAHDLPIVIKRNYTAFNELATTIENAAKNGPVSA